MTTVQIPVEDGSLMNGYLAGGPASSAVIVLHELFGVNPDLQEVVDDLAAAGCVAVAPELYHRNAPPGHWLPRDDAGRAEGFALLHRLTRPELVLDVAATMALLTTSYGARRITVVGFSAGGHAAYVAACLLPIDAAVVLYGGWLTGTELELSRPNPTLELTPGLTGSLTYLVGEDDALISAGERSAIAEALAPVGGELVGYPGVGHAFFWAGTPPFDQAAHDDAWRRILATVS